MRLSRAIDDKKLDLRLRDKWLLEGKISKDQLEEYMNSLEDDAANMTTTAEVEAQKQPSASE